MFVKMFLVCAVVAVAMGIEYPPGVHPSVCPNYPYCNIGVLARHTPQGMPIPDWELSHVRMVPPYPNADYLVPDLNRAKLPESAKYPADVDPASCPDYPFCI